MGYVVACHHPDYQLPLGREVVAVDAAYFRPTEVELLIGDPSRAKAELGWVPTYDLPALVSDMMQSDLQLFRRDAVLVQAGHPVLSYHDE